VTAIYHDFLKILRPKARRFSPWLRAPKGRCMKSVLTDFMADFSLDKATVLGYTDVQNSLK